VASLVPAARLVTLTAVLVPDLRPLSVGEIIDVAIKIWRRHLATLARIVFVVVAPVQVLAGLVTASVSSPETVFNGVDATGNSSVNTHALAGWLAGMITAQILSGLAFLISSAAVLRAVSVAYLGGTPDWRESLRAATGRLGSLIWLAFLLLAGLAAAMLALFVPFIWLGVSWSLAFPILIAEGARGTGALGRSFRLVRGRWWPTFGALFLGMTLQSFIGFVFAIPLAVVNATGGAGSLAGIALGTVLGVASSVITTPFMAAVLVLIYFDLRVRKEAFDLQLLAQGVGVPEAAFAAPGGWTAAGGSWAAGAGGWPAPGGSWPSPTRSAPPGEQWWGPAGNWPTPGGSAPPPGGSPAGPAGGSAPGPGGSPGGAPASPARPSAAPAPPAGPVPAWGEPIDPTGGRRTPPARDEPFEGQSGGEPPQRS
jgi:hypothetical protein